MLEIKDAKNKRCPFLRNFCKVEQCMSWVTDDIKYTVHNDEDTYDLPYSLLPFEEHIEDEKEYLAKISVLLEDRWVIVEKTQGKTILKREGDNRLGHCSMMGGR